MSAGGCSRAGLANGVNWNTAAWSGRRSPDRKSSLNAWEAKLSIRPPVEDWATDFDHLDPRWIEDPFPIWAELRSSCPVAHTNRFQGVYLPTRYKDIREIAYDTQAFSSRRVQVRATPPPIKSPAPPITSDPPHHRLARMVLLPPFTPAAIDKLIPEPPS